MTVFLVVVVSWVETFGVSFRINLIISSLVVVGISLENITSVDEEVEEVVPTVIEVTPKVVN